MTQPTTTTRGPILHDLITVTPLGGRLFEVLALDDLDGEFVYAVPVDERTPAQWYSLTHVKVVEPQGSAPMAREALTGAGASGDHKPAQQSVD